VESAGGRQKSKKGTVKISTIIPKKMLLGLTAGLIGASIALVLYLSGLLDFWEAKTWDLRVNMMAKPSKTSDKIRVIFLDQNSLDWGKTENGLSWPWPREVYGPIIQFCKRSGVKSLAFDVVYTEPSPYGVEDDQRFAAVIQDFGKFIGTVYSSQSEGDESIWPAYAPEPLFRILGLDGWMSAMDSSQILFRNASFPIPEIAAAANILGDVKYNPDQDNVCRVAALFHVFDGRVLPSLALAAYLAAQPDTTLKIEPGWLTVGDRKIPIDKQGKAVINFRGPSGTHRTYNAAEIIQSELKIQNGEKPAVDPADLRDAYVLFGFSAPGLFDLRPTPVAGIYPGVEIYATMLDNLLANDFFKPVPTASVLVITLLIAVLAGLATASVSGIARSTPVYVFFVAAPVVLCFYAYYEGWWLHLMVQETAVVFTLFSGLLIYYTTEGRQKIFIKNAFRQYLSHAVIEQLIQNPENLKLGGERRMLSIFFSDLEGFTGISEGLEPEALTALLNDYLTAMTDIIQEEEGGTVDKYEGDAIIALWNAPVLQEDHAQRCVRAALRCQMKLAEMRPMFRKRLGKDLRMRIGMNSGFAVVGNMGSHTRFDYTMIGDAVNLASRLEGINKQFGTYAIVSQSTMELMQGLFPVRELAKVAVVGRKEPVVVYEPMMQEEFDRRKPQLNVFAEGLSLFYKGDFQTASEVFSSIKDSDPAARSYMAKCSEMIDHPPVEWKGIWVITSK
jgi:adenylate cyclase